MAGQNRAARIAALEERYLDLSLASRNRTMGEEFAEHGFTQAEVERAGEWLAVCLRLDAEPLNAQQLAADELAAMNGARWLHCRLQHGPGLCEATCTGEDRHRPAWKPAQGSPASPQESPEDSPEVSGSEREPEETPPEPWRGRILRPQRRPKTWF
jgi:hypothetical protein